MFAGILTFLRGPWGPIIMKVMMALTLATLIYVAVSNYNENIRETERSANRNAQLEQVLKDNEEFRQKLIILEEKSDKILEDTKEKNDKVSDRHTKTTRYITSPEAQKSNRPSSDVIKNTIGMLRDED
jgi:hypothetical protein